MPPLQENPVNGALGGRATEGHRPAPVGARRPTVPVVVDDDLIWLVPVPELSIAAAHASSARALSRLSAALDRQLASATAAPDTSLVDVAARLVAACLRDLPDLPYIGEPFGGVEGTD